MKTALITGINGQDGSFLAELLLSKGYLVHGIIRRASQINTQRLSHLFKELQDPEARLFLHYADLTDASSLRATLMKARPSEIYHLGAQSHVRVSFDQPEYTADVVAMGTMRLLEAIRDYQEVTGQAVRYYQAGSSEMFGSSPPPQTENTPFHPCSPYGCAKLFGFWQTVNYRESYNLFACNGILFNHESERRGETFVTRKITRAATRIKLGLQNKLYLGNLNARRDWGFAGDYVEAMWLMLQADSPDDYVVGTGQCHTVREVVDKAFALVDLDPEAYLEQDPRYLRPREVEHLRADASKIEKALGWRPAMTFDALIDRMVQADLRLAEQDKLLQDANFPVYQGVEC